MHARRARPESRASDQRRLFAAVLSALLPGLGQAFNGSWKMAAIFAIPSLILIGVALLLLQLNSTTMLLARAVVPANLTGLVILNLVLLGWRLLAVLDAFADRRYPGRPSRNGWIGLALIFAFVALPHLVAHVYGTTASSTFERVFSGVNGDPVGGADDDAG